MSFLDANLQIKRGNFYVNTEFTLPNDGITALFGPSGCGKSTLLRAIAGLHYADERQQGTIRLVANATDNVWLAPGEPSVPAWQRKVGFVFQHPALFPHLSVAKNLAFAWQRVSQEEQHQHAIFTPKAVAEMCGITALLDRKPEQLSGGQQQRVAIARALVSCPQVLLLDEPLANLDHSAKAEFIALLKRIHKVVQIPMLYVSHQLDEVVQLADYLLLMDNGKLISSGNIAEVLQGNEGFSRCGGENIIQGIISEQQTPESGLLEITVAGQQVSFPDPRLKYSGAIEPSSHRAGCLTATLSENNKTLGESELSDRGDEFAPGSRCRIHIRARELSIATEQSAASSIRNYISGVILSFHPTQHPAELRVCIAIGAKENGSGAQNTQMVSALITKTSAERLHLTELMAVYLQIKAVALSY